MNKRRRELLLRRSLSTSTILANAKKPKAPPKQQHPITIQPSSSHSRVSRNDILEALPPPPLMEESEREEKVIISHKNRRDQLAGTRKVVSFSSKSKCAYLEPRTQEEKYASFYSQEEYKRIYSENIHTIKKMDESSSKTTKLPASETQHFRGLLASRARYEREQRIKFVVKNVLKEQEKSKTLDEDWVKDFSNKFSKQTAIAALYLARIDARAAGAAAGAHY